MTTPLQRAEAAHATWAAADAAYTQKPTNGARLRRNKAWRALQAANAELNRIVDRNIHDDAAERAASPAPAATHTARIYDESPAARELRAATDAYDGAQQRAQHPGRGKTRAIAQQEADAYSDRLQAALDDAARRDPIAYAAYKTAGARTANEEQTR